VTDATRSYAARVLPPTWRILGKRLHSLTLGHAHLLCAATEWRPWEPYEMTDELFATGLYVCTRPWRKVRLESRGAAWFAVGLAIRGRLARTNLAEKGAAFADYLLWHTSGPRIRANASRAKLDAAPRTLGSPPIARLRIFAQPFGGLDALMAEIYWLWAAHEEEAGTLRVMNQGEMYFDDFCAREETKAARAGRE